VGEVAAEMRDRFGVTLSEDRRVGQGLSEKARERRQRFTVPAERLAAEIGIAPPFPFRLQGAFVRFKRARWPLR
jgi:hypothetical protein